MNSTNQITKNSNIATLYKNLRKLVFQDPIMTAIATGKMSWADAMTEQDEAKYQDFITHGEGAVILNSFREALNRENKKKKS